MTIFFRRRRRGAATHDGHSYSILAAGLTIIGDVDTDGTVRIDGRLEGSVRRAGSVTIGVGATVCGNVAASEVVVGGSVHGNIDAAERVELQPTAIVTGDIDANAILIHEGGTVRGRLCVRSREPHPSLASPAPETGLAIPLPSGAS